MTFNSYRIMRHMTRLLHVSGDTSLAKRTLRLYVQLVDKAWQATGAGVGEVDADKDRDWVETLMFGVRMFCKLASAYPGGDGIEDVREAENLIHKARLRLNQDDKDLVASVDLSEGIVQHMLAIKGMFFFLFRLFSGWSHLKTYRTRPPHSTKPSGVCPHSFRSIRRGSSYAFSVLPPRIIVHPTRSYAGHRCSPRQCRACRRRRFD